MIWIILFLVNVTLIAVLVALLLKYRRELRSLAKQIEDVKNGTTHKYIDVSLLDSDLEHLAFEINSLIKKKEDLCISVRKHEARLKESIANISHDLRTPLTSILGYTFLAQNTEGVDKDEALRVIEEKAKLLNKLIQSFFELSVIDDDRYELLIERVDIVAITTNTLMGSYSLFEDKEIVPCIQLPAHGVYIKANTLACERILQNLIANAVLYTTGKVIVKMDITESDCIISISNTAPELREETVNHLFDRFYMTDDSRSNGHTGLGLTIVKTLIEKIGAEINSTTLIESVLKIEISFPLWTDQYL